jgi:mRNA-degrading endonuclease RelE of RelBE toxin-antitoxin system
VRNELLYAKEAAKILRALPAKERARLGPLLEKLADDPFLGKQLTGPLADLRSLRVGKYRVIYSHLPAERRVIVLTLCRRKEIYKKARRKK